MKWTHAVLALPIAAGLGGSLWWYLDYAATYPSTADAYVGRHIVRIAAQVSGPIQSVAVRNNQEVKAGDLLLTIDPAPFALALDQAQAQLEETKERVAAAAAQVDLGQAQVAAAQAKSEEASRHAERIATLVAKGSASKDLGDSAEEARRDAEDALASARANLAAARATRGALGPANAAIQVAEAALARARLDLAYTRISAPADGTLGELDLRPGGYVTAGTPLFALVERHDVWVDANFKETDLPRIRPGQAARVQVDLLPGRSFQGRVEGLSPASGAAFSLLPPENATGNWVKVSQRFPVRVQILDPVPELRVGASAEVRVDTRSP